MTRTFVLALTLVVMAAAATAQTGDPKVLEAQRLRRLQSLLNPTQPVAIGQPVPDFTLRDQQELRVTLSSLKGKVVAMTFGYVRCPNPQYCFRLASNLGQVQSRLKDRMGRDVVLLTVMLDPEHDQGRALAEYAQVWTTQPLNWRFLTGSVADVKRVAGLFGVQFLREEGAVIHSLNTVVIDRQGRLVANLEGNAFSADKLVDTVKTALDQP